MSAVEIVDYRPHWAEEFEQIAAVVRSGLGEQALRVDHIGSTSVPGLASKDVIDVQVSVARFDDALIDAFVRLGYSLHPVIQGDHRPPGASGPDSDWEKRYFDPPPGQRNTHMHVRILGRPNQRYALLFRDYLRAHPAAAAGYAALKRTLAQYMGEDRQAYTLIKDPVCDIIQSAAEDWAAATGWDRWA
jgi:GrpB-like predicted nucleotidyltransferase (UPF0157 family)